MIDLIAEKKKGDRLSIMLNGEENIGDVYLAGTNYVTRKKVGFHYYTNPDLRTVAFVLLGEYSKVHKLPYVRSDKINFIEN